MLAKADNHPFAGIAEKLGRADENIVNLHNEILAFFETGKYPVIPNPDDEHWQEAVNYHKNLRVPLRFSVLAGEIVHHLRSCLDHIVWVFSSESARRDHEGILAFPILCEVPNKKKLARYNAQIQGIADPSSVRDLIWQVQPCNRGANIPDDPLCLIHNMDRLDKHRELVIVTSCANLTLPDAKTDIAVKVMEYRQGKTLSTADVAAVSRAIKYDAKVAPQVAFAKFGKWETQFVVPALTHLLNAVDDVAELFAREVSLKPSG